MGTALTNHLEKYMTVSAILGRHPMGVRYKYWVTSAEWQEVVAEIQGIWDRQQEINQLNDKKTLVLPKAKRGLNDVLHISHNLTVVNAATEDQLLVNGMNLMECPEWFQSARKALQSGVKTPDAPEDR